MLRQAIDPSSTEAFSANLLKMRLDQAKQLNIGSGSTKSSIESAFSSAGYDKMAALQKKKQISSLLTAKSNPSNQIKKNLFQNVYARNQVASETKPTANVKPIIPNIPISNLLNSTMTTPSVQSSQGPDISTVPGEKFRPASATSFSTTFKSNNISATDGDGLYSMSSVHVSESDQGDRSPFLHGAPSQRESFLLPSGMSAGYANNQKFSQPYNQIFPQENKHFENAYGKGGYPASPFQPLHLASNSNNRNSKQSGRNTSSEGLNNLRCRFNTNSYSDNISDNKRQFSSLRGKNNPGGENLFQSTLSYHLANKISKRHLSQR